VAAGYVTLEAARTDYGVAVDPATLQVDAHKTRRLRRAG
jgi:hypothetical protein